MGKLIKTAGKEMILAEDQLLLYSKLMAVIDRNPNLNGNTKDHNDDFCVIKTKHGQSIEITRNFALKLQHLASYNFKPEFPPSITEFGKHLHIAVAVKLWDERGEVTEVGGCSTSEINEKNRSRAFHDALARAVTRGLKRALEAKAGLPFVNMLIKELFGGFDIQGRTTPGGRNVTGSGTLAVDSQRLGNEIHKMLLDARNAGKISPEEVNKHWNETMLNISQLAQLENIKNTIEILIRERGDG